MALLSLTCADHKATIRLGRLVRPVRACDCPSVSRKLAAGRCSVFGGAGRDWVSALPIQSRLLYAELRPHHKTERAFLRGVRHV